MLSEETKTLEKDRKMGSREVAREQRVFIRILGLFLIIYGLLVLSQPLLYGLGLPENLIPLLGLGFVLFGAYLVIRR